MNKLAASLAVSLLLLAGCGGGEPAATATAPAAAPPVAAATDQPQAPAPADAAKVTASADNDGESVDESTVEITPIAAAVAANTPGPAAPAAFRWKEGQHFTQLPTAQPTSAAAGKVEVTEIFWYGCGHCYHLEAVLESWDKNKRPAYVQLTRLPVIWTGNDVTRSDARLYYTIEALGRPDLHMKAFQEIHVNRNPFSVVEGQRLNEAGTERKVREFLTKNGVGEADIARTYRSFPVDNKLRLAENLSKRYIADHTPMVVVNGRYVTDVGMAGGQDQLFQLVNDLAARERGTR